MKHKITTTIIGIILISCISANSIIDITAGESTTLELLEEYVYYEVSGNTTWVDFNLTKNGCL